MIGFNFHIKMPFKDYVNNTVNKMKSTMFIIDFKQQNNHYIWYNLWYRNEISSLNHSYGLDNFLG
jgi:hypothetical protein